MWRGPHRLVRAPGCRDVPLVAIRCPHGVRSGASGPAVRRNTARRAAVNRPRTNARSAAATSRSPTPQDRGHGPKPGRAHAHLLLATGVSPSCSGDVSPHMWHGLLIGVDSESLPTVRGRRLGCPRASVSRAGACPAGMPRGSTADEHGPGEGPPSRTVPAALVVPRQGPASQLRDRLRAGVSPRRVRTPRTRLGGARRVSTPFSQGTPPLPRCPALHPRVRQLDTGSLPRSPISTVWTHQRGRPRPALDSSATGRFDWRLAGEATTGVHRPERSPPRSAGRDRAHPLRVLVGHSRLSIFCSSARFARRK